MNIKDLKQEWIDYSNKNNISMDSHDIYEINNHIIKIYYTSDCGNYALYTVDSCNILKKRQTRFNITTSDTVLTIPKVGTIIL